ncbi:polysaccharide deacetylase family protein [Kitasatospora sp. LaBMicrA B282]|uniref:polysaccharide deacetylase family protein n=1 Tax=Kitasatospora sp. LaBMicrA B282 TaxID=3420949 RepID=UPI003D0D938B
MTMRRRGLAVAGVLGVLLALGTAVPGRPGPELGRAPRQVPPEPAAPAATVAGEPDCTRLRCVALTFDDGPSDRTPQLLDVLAAERVRATFFVVGQEVAARPAVVRRELAEGHVVGDHTWDHAQLTLLDPERMAREIDQGADAVQRATGVRPTLLRPPYGAFSAAVRGRGLPLVLWDVDSFDWRDDDAAATARRGIEQARPGSVILMHDIVPSTPRAVRPLIEGLRARGFTLVTVAQLFGHPLAAGQDYPRAPAGPPATPHPGAVTWRYRPAAGPDPDQDQVVAAPEPGRCHPTGRPGFALRDETDRDVEMYRDGDCTVKAARLHPGDELYGEVGGFRVLAG